MKKSLLSISLFVFICHSWGMGGGAYGCRVIKDSSTIRSFKDAICAMSINSWRNVTTGETFTIGKIDFLDSHGIEENVVRISSHCKSGRQAHIALEATLEELIAKGHCSKYSRSR